MGDCIVKIETVPISKIRRAKYNPRKPLKPGDPAYDKLKKAITAFGLVEPLVWNKRTKNLVGGHQRLSVLEERGDTEVEVSVVDLDERDEKALNLALNKHVGEWDFASLADLVQELDSGDFDMELTGFDDKELEQICTWTPEEEKTSSAGVDLKEQYMVIVECKSEADQRKCLEDFTKKGLKCRALLS